MVRPLGPEHVGRQDELHFKPACGVLLGSAGGYRIQGIDDGHHRVALSVQGYLRSGRGSGNCVRNRSRLHAGADGKNIAACGKFLRVIGTGHDTASLGDGIQRNAIQSQEDGRSHSTVQSITKLVCACRIVGFPVGEPVFGVEGGQILNGILRHLPVHLRGVEMTGFLQPVQGFRPADQIGGKGGTMRIVAVEIILAGGFGQLEVRQGQISQIFFHIKGCVLRVEAA